MSNTRRKDAHYISAWLDLTDRDLLDSQPGTTRTAKLQNLLHQGQTPQMTRTEQIANMEWREIRLLLKALVKQAKLLGWVVTLGLPDA